jgi:hypothetical protein
LPSGLHAMCAAQGHIAQSVRHRVRRSACPVDAGLKPLRQTFVENLLNTDDFLCLTFQQFNI